MHLPDFAPFFGSGFLARPAHPSGELGDLVVALSFVADTDWPFTVAVPPWHAAPQVTFRVWAGAW